MIHADLASAYALHGETEGVFPDSLLEESGFEPSVPLGEKRSFRNASIIDRVKRGTRLMKRELHRTAYRGGRKRYRRGRLPGSRRSDHSNTATAVGAAGETCGLNSGNLNILSEARIRAPELISDQVSVDPIEEVLCPSLVSREVRRRCVIPSDDCFVELVPKGDAIHDFESSQLDLLNL